MKTIDWEEYGNKLVRIHASTPSGDSVLIDGILRDFRHSQVHTEVGVFEISVQRYGPYGPGYVGKILTESMHISLLAELEA